MYQKDLDVLKIIMRSGKPMSLPDILKEHPELVKSTVAAALAKLLKEGYIKVAGIGYSGKSICRTYQSTGSSQELFLKNITEEYNNISDIVPKSDLFAALIRLNQDENIAREEIAQLKIMLENFEVEHRIKCVKEEIRKNEDDFDINDRISK